MSWPLTGRTQEMEFIEAALSASDTSGILVSGAAGVGKSRIAREALSAAEAQGYECRRVIGTSPARAVPLGVFAAWADPDITDTVQLLRGVIESLTSTASGAPVVLSVDDVFLLDDLSLFVLLQIVQREAAKVILTVRDGEPIPVAVQEIWKVGRFERLDLQPLSLDETTTLLSAALGGSIDPDASYRLWTLTQGNALYLRNIVEQEVADGRLVQRQRYWKWKGDPVMPRGLVELIESRIRSLPTSVGEVVDALAVGEPIELAALARITDPDAVEDADTRALITLEQVAGGIEARVAHPLYGEIRRKHAPVTRLRRLRGLIAAELAASDDRDDIRVVVRRATLSLDSDLALDHELLVRAANGAVWLADLSLADRLAEAAVRAGAGLEPKFIRAHALSWLSHGEAADAVLAEIDTSSLTETERARLAFLRASNMLWALGDPARAKELIDNAYPPTSSPDARTYIDAFLTVYWFAVDQPDKAIQTSTDLVPEDLPSVVGAEVAWVLAVMYADAGRIRDAVSAAETGYAVAARSFDPPQMRFNIADAHVSAMLLSGRVDEALQVAEHVRDQAADLPGAAQLIGTAVAGRAALGAGRLSTARSLLGQATIGLTASGHTIGWAYRYQIPYATALAMSGATDEAGAILDRIDELQRRFRSLDYERSLARAWVAAGQGAVSEAIAIALSAAEIASAKGQFAAEVVSLQTAVQFGDRSSAPRLRELEPIVEGPRVTLTARFAEALRDAAADDLMSVSLEFERLGDLVAAVDSAAHAALVHRHEGRRGSALNCSTRADALAKECGVSSPALRQAGDALPLTSREREIVMLLADGLTNQTIAQRLTLSVRTVESHIYRAMAKTGATNREELAALLPRRSASTVETAPE